MIRARTLVSAYILLFIIGCLPQPAATPEPPAVVATVKQVMDAITTPTSDVVWSVGIDPPESEAEWDAIEANALALAESGNLLLMPGRAVDQGEWVTLTRAMIDAAILAAAAARERDLDATFDAGDAIYDTCTACHAVYMPMP